MGKGIKDKLRLQQLQVIDDKKEFGLVIRVDFEFEDDKITCQFLIDRGVSLSSFINTLREMADKLGQAK